MAEPTPPPRDPRWPTEPGSPASPVPAHLPALGMAEPATMERTPSPALRDIFPKTKTAGAAIPFRSPHVFLPRSSQTPSLCPGSPPLPLTILRRGPSRFFPSPSSAGSSENRPPETFPASPTCPFPVPRCPVSVAPSSAGRSSPAPAAAVPPCSGAGEGMEVEQGKLYKAKGKHPNSVRETIFFFLSLSFFFFF